MDTGTLQNPPNTLAGLLSNPAVRQLLTLVAIAASVALGVSIILWSRAPNYNLLYANLDEAQAAEVMQALQSADIPYRLQGNGAVTVPAKFVQEARMKLAGDGLPSSSGLGLDVLQDDPGFGVSQFIETKRYNHGLETELGRTIAQLKPVKSARVHLALAKDSVFIRDRGKTSASVLLEVHPGLRLESQQVAAIVYFLARSVNGLEAEQVTVVDQTGRMLNSPDESTDYAMSANQFEHTQRVEDVYVQRIESLLAPLVGLGKVRAKVVADLDFTVSEQTRESFDPERSALRSENTSFSERRGSEAGAQGVPGALSNQPPVGGNAGATTDPADAVDPIDTSRNALRNFEVDRTISHTRQATGEIRRLSVAVIVDDRQSVDDAGALTHTPRTQAELDQLNALVREAVGFDEARGDSIQVINSSFQTVADGEPPVAPKLWETPLFRDLLKQGIGVALVLIVIFGLLRPMLRGLLQSAAPAPSAGRSATALPADGSGALPAQAGNFATLAAPAVVPVEEHVEAARKLAAQDPQRVAQVVKTWVAEGG